MESDFVANFVGNFVAFVESNSESPCGGEWRGLLLVIVLVLDTSGESLTEARRTRRSSKVREF